MTAWLDHHTVDLLDRLLDRHVVGENGATVGKVDDVELRELPDGTYVVEGLLVGIGALAARIGGRPGRLLRALGKRLHANPEPVHIPLTEVRQAAPEVVVTERAAEKAASAAERWLRESVINRIPGARDARG